MPAISCHIPCNLEAFLPLAVSSILQQSYRDLDILIAWNGNTPAPVINGENVKIIETAPNQQYLARNRLIEESDSEYIAVMDADDWAYPDRFKYQIEFLSAHPDCLAVGSFAEICDAHLNRIRIAQLPTDYRSISICRKRWVNTLIHPTLVYRRSALALIGGGYDLKYTVASSFDFWQRLVAAGPVANLPEILLKKRCHDRQTKSKDKIKVIAAIRREAEK